MAELARVATFLASEGKALNVTAYALFVDAVSDNLLPAITLLEQRANGDYSRDETPDSFPPFTDGPTRSVGVSCWELFEGYVTATRRAPQTVSRWRAVFLQMQRDFAEAGAGGITEDAARSWIAGLITEERSANTVREVWLSASRTLFNWGVRHKRVAKNPFADVPVNVPRKIRRRETKAFRPEEARVILRASLTYGNPKTPRNRARHWVPWLCAYSGARAGEITQLRGADVQQCSDFYTMNLTPDAGTTKTGTARLVPIHEHLVKQGFVQFVQKSGKGPLFYNPAETSPDQGDPLKPPRTVRSFGDTHSKGATWYP